MTGQDASGPINTQFVALPSSNVKTPLTDENASPLSLRRRVTAGMAAIEAAARANNPVKLKALVRTNMWPMTHDIRTKLWRVLSIGPDLVEDTLYEEYSKKLFDNGEDEDLPISIADELRVHNMLNPMGIQATQRVLYVIGETNPHITEFSPLLYAVAATLMHYMTETECFAAIYQLIKSRVHYFLSPSSTQLKASVYVLKDLAFTYCKSAAAGLERLCVEGDLTDLCDEWVLWIFKYLPFDYLVAVVDCYLVEGYKVLFRVALTLLMLYHKNCDREPNVEKPEVAIQRFCQNIESTITIDKLLKTAFGIRGFTRREITSLFFKNEMLVKKQEATDPKPVLPSNSHGKGLGGGPTVVSRPPPIQRQFSRASSILNFRKPPPHIRRLDRKVSTQSFKLDQRLHHNFMLEGVESSILDHGQLQQLWSYLPDLQGVQEPEKVFTTATHGYSISRFYEHVEGRGPTLLLIRTMDGDTFGAYCSMDWENRRHNVDMGANVSFFGTGESFVFKMRPDPYIYHWVGKVNHHAISTCSMFMAADKSFLILGGGGGEAIYIDETLDHGKSAHCTTYNNSVLVESDDGCFQIQDMEVFAFV